MDSAYSAQVQEKLSQAFQETALHRPMHRDRFEAGTELSYDVLGVAQARRGRVRLLIERFVGGGYAGQVYRVKVLALESEDGSIDGLRPDGVYAMKILIPPNGFARLFRNTLYWLGFQGPFQLQVNPVAARSGALWQTLIRRGARIRFGDERAVTEIHATFVDTALGSCGELSEWIEGRTWRLEADEHLDALSRWSRGERVDPALLGSPEYREKKAFMDAFVGLLHDMGAHEFARQYTWSTWKSQPNCLKRRGMEGLPYKGLTAVDFRAGLVLLPFLPMSPGDFRLILEGIGRGSLVQFDRGNLGRLERFLSAHGPAFADLRPLFEELKSAERTYRDSVPDVTHNHLRLLCSSRLWSTIFDSAVTGWRVRNLVEAGCEERLRRSRGLAFLFFLLGLIPLLGGFFRKIWCRSDYRRHYGRMLASRDYLRRALRGKLLEKTIAWHRAGRVSDARALKIMDQIWRGTCHLPLTLLPAGLHRLLTDAAYARASLDHLLLRPVRLYFDAALREQWLREMVQEGRKNHLLTAEDAEVIFSQVKEPYIQKYLKSLAVHLCTLPVTQVVSLLVAALYVMMHPEMPRAQAYGIGLGIIALFQVVPISPGSLVRGLYVLYLVIRERNFKDYNIAVFLGFFKYVGYLAFPIQMAYRYPTLARFMAGHWATEASHAIPVFGERGALLEHKVFSLFYNWPLTVRRRLRERYDSLSGLEPRYWHMPLCAVLGAVLFALADSVSLDVWGHLPHLRAVWWLTLGAPLLGGAMVSSGAGGAPMSHRLAGAALCGTVMALLSAAFSWAIGGDAPGSEGLLLSAVWRVFLFTLFAVLGLLLTEVTLPGRR